MSNKFFSITFRNRRLSKKHTIIFWSIRYYLCFLLVDCDSRTLTPINDTSMCLLQKLHLALFKIFFTHDLYLGFNNHSSLKVDLEYFLLTFFNGFNYTILKRHTNFIMIKHVLLSKVVETYQTMYCIKQYIKTILFDSHTVKPLDLLKICVI